MLWQEILPEFFARLSVANRQSLKAICNGRMGCQRTMGIVLVEQITEIKCSSDKYRSRLTLSIVVGCVHENTRNTRYRQQHYRPPTITAPPSSILFTRTRVQDIIRKWMIFQMQKAQRPERKINAKHILRIHPI